MAMAPDYSNVDAVITDEMIEVARSRIGVVHPIKRQWHSEATRDAVRHWAEGIGDTNPLWLDEKYARSTVHGTLLAPPSFVFSCNQGPMHRDSQPSKGRAMPGIHAIWGGEQWEWFQQIRLGDRIRGTTEVTEVNVHERSEFTGRSTETITVENFYNQDDDLLSRHRMSFFHTERRRASTIGKYAGIKKHRYSDEELQQIDRDIDREVVRGGTSRFWEDVEVGEVIPHVVKGPLTLTEMIAFLQGWGGPFIMASEVTHRYLRLHPRANVPDPSTNAPDFPERAHWEEAFAQACGFPSGYDIGVQRFSWMLHGLTNWIGDAGMVRRAGVKFVALNILGDTTWCEAVVSGKRQEDNRFLVDLDISTRNQRGVRSTEGTATVELPHRG